MQNLFFKNKYSKTNKKIFNNYLAEKRVDIIQIMLTSLEI